LKKIAIFILAILTLACQKPQHFTALESDTGEICRIMFWNVENLFDVRDDSLTQDDEFLPNGEKSWNSSRYKLKINNMYKVFISAGDWNPPDLIGLCEVENKFVLIDLIKNTPFNFYNYRFIHHESPDRRGIDVALLYNPETITILSDTAIPVQLPNASVTRDILLARIKIITGDTISLLVNHWPSKYGGAGFTEDLRAVAAETLSEEIQKIAELIPREKIVIMGDFNDTPESNSIKILTKCMNRNLANEPSILINMAENYASTIPGSYKFDGTWELIDQILVSRNFLPENNLSCIKNGSFKVFSPTFLLVRDEKFGGMKPFRTYSGYKYSGGFSDHLPVILDLYAGKE